MLLTRAPWRSFVTMLRVVHLPEGAVDSVDCQIVGWGEHAATQTQVVEKVLETLEKIVIKLLIP